jgi:hypothetical protein
VDEAQEKSGGFDKFTMRLGHLMLLKLMLPNAQELCSGRLGTMQNNPTPVDQFTPFGNYGTESPYDDYSYQ